MIIPLIRHSLFICTILLLSCKTVPNYPKPDQPVWKNNTISKGAKPDTTIKILSFNIQFSNWVHTAIRELTTIETLQDADIIFLQEMDESGTMIIAHQLGYNYLYYPGSRTDNEKKNFGNAILSKWPLKNEQKIILPHRLKTTKRIRTATLATTTIDGKTILLASAHFETVVLKRCKRMYQACYFASQLNNHPDSTYIIAGGDFNTLFKSFRKKIVRHFEASDLLWASSAIGPTGSELFGLLRPINDHIFSRGFEVVRSGKFSDTKASDHYPIWVELMWEH